MAKKPRQPVKRNSDLIKHFDSINKKQFGGTVCGGIGWRHISLGEESITQASCNFSERFISVNTFLDDTRIPVWYLKFVIYHEMLHLHLGPQQFEPDGCAVPHNERFESLESRHADYLRAVDYEDKKLSYISESWRIWRAWKRSKRNKKNA